MNTLNNKKTVIFINIFLEVNGIVTLALRKAKWLIERGYKVYFITSLHGTMHKEFQDIGVNFIYDTVIGHPPCTMLISDLLNLINNIINKINKMDDVFVIESFTPIETVYGLIIANLVGTKLITGIYHPQQYTTGHYMKNQNFKKLIFLLEKNNAILFMNNDVIEAHEKFYDFNINNKNILPIPVEIKKYKKINKRNNEFNILSIGRLCDFKKYVYGLISDFDKFYKEHSNSKIIIIGDGIEKKKLIKYARSFKSYKEGKIYFLGTIQYSELDKYIYNASMVVGMGTSLLEMASTGVPSIIAPAFVEHNISNGFNFEDDNVGDEKNSCTKTYLDYMELLYNCNDEEYEKIGKQCRQAVIDKYSIDNIMSQWLNKVDECKPIVLSAPLDDFVQRSPLRIFLSMKKRKLEGKLRKFVR